MKLLRRGLIGVAILLLLAAAGFWWLTEAEGAVPRTVIPFSDLRKYRQWLEDYHPTQLEEGETYSITLSQEDVQKLAILLASTQPWLAHSQFRATITPDALTLEVWWPTRILGRYLPLRLVWHPDQPFQARHLAVAGWRLPSSVVARLNRRLDRQPVVGDARQVWERLSPDVLLEERAMTLVVDWEDPEFFSRFRNVAPFWVDPEQRRQLTREVVWLQAWLEAQESFRIPLRDVLKAMVTREGFDWDRDAPAMLGALTYASMGQVSGLRPGEDLPELPFKRFTLHDRYDLARHFLLAMWLGTQMDSESVLELAIYKEWSDATSRPSGFSAEDMVANVAGLELLQWLRRAGQIGRQDFRPATDDTLMPPADFWIGWQQDDNAALTERQIRELVQATRSWLGDSPLYRQ